MIEDMLINNHDMLYKIAMRYLKNHEDALDALQDTAYKAIKNSHKLKNLEYASTWITRILINNCLQILKKNKRYLDFENSFEFSELESNIELDELLLSLKPNYRGVIVLKYIEGYKIKEIADMYNKPESTIKTWLRRALKSLKSEVLI